jgi:predicted DNA-binding mobile mystery protein A
MYSDCLISLKAIMKKAYQQLLRDQIDRKTKVLSKLAGDIPAGGWIRSIREALGLSGRQLAVRMGITQASLAGFEKRELAGTASLSSLRKIADAMDCDLVYAIVPRKPVTKLLEDRARVIATQRVDRINVSMGLEQQANSPSYRKKMIRMEVKRLMEEAPEELWEK